MGYALAFVGLVIGALVISFGLDFIGKFIPIRLVDAAAVIGVLFWLRWVLKDLIKEAVSEAIRENKN